jgi:hypothetical protein
VKGEHGKFLFTKEATANLMIREVRYVKLFVQVDVLDEEA